MYKVSVKSMLCGYAIALVSIYSILIKFAAQDNLVARCPVLMTVIQASQLFWVAGLSLTERNTKFIVALGIPGLCSINPSFIQYLDFPTK